MSAVLIQDLDCPVAKDTLEISEVEVGGRQQAFTGCEINQVRRTRTKIAFDTPWLPGDQTAFWKALFRPGALSAHPVYEDLYSEQGHVPTIVGTPTFSASGGPLSDPESCVLLEANGEEHESITWEIATGVEIDHYALLCFFNWTEPWPLWGLSTWDDEVYADGVYVSDVATCWQISPISASFANGVTSIKIEDIINGTPFAGLVWLPGKISGPNIVKPLTALGTTGHYWDLPRVYVSGTVVPSAGRYTGRVTGKRAMLISNVLYEQLHVELTEV